MPVETATKISELNPLWPLGTDFKEEGDNHIRLIKSVLQATDGGALSRIVVTTQTGSGTYTKPAGLKFLEVTLVGGGGGGGAAASTVAGQSSAGGGGGGGGTVIKLYPASAIAATEAYVTGSGGTTPGGVGNPGGNSTFKGLSATGGGGGGAVGAAGTTLAVQQGGGPGNATGGDLNIVGAYGANGVRAFTAATVAMPGNGGATFLALEPSRVNVFVGSTSPGDAGRFPGGGGGGGANGATQAVAASGAGASGCIIFREYF
jgi:hypothetical protein